MISEQRISRNGAIILAILVLLSCGVIISSLYGIGKIVVKAKIEQK